ncbi:hypothetical protein JCM10908_000455 [Rhodotorula pacifica]|uniref:uncharacterized protein n=1 Tax=Rhodotorula pacifica TaxID=1495444 RepID=UPI00317DEE14
MQRTVLTRLARPTRLPMPVVRAGLPARRMASTEAHAASSAEASEVYPQEGFNAPFWRTLSIAAVGVFLYLRLAESSDKVPTPSELVDKVEEKVTVPPYLTRYISHNLAPDADKYKERNDKHLELAKQAADDKLLFQEAERPRMRRLRYLGTFNQQSPNNVQVGTQADLSDLTIKSEKDDFAAEA